MSEQALRDLVKISEKLGLYDNQGSPMTAPLEPKMPEPDVSYEAARDDRDLRYAHSTEAMQAYGDARARHAAEVERARCAALCDEEAEADATAVNRANTEHGRALFEAMSVGAGNCAAAIRATEATKEGGQAEQQWDWFATSKQDQPQK